MYEVSSFLKSDYGNEFYQQESSRPVSVLAPLLALGVFIGTVF